MNVQAVVDELNRKLPLALDAVEVTYKYVKEGDPRLDQQLMLQWNQNITIHDGLMMVVSCIKSNGLVLTPFVLIGTNLIQAFVSSKPLGNLPGEHL